MKTFMVKYTETFTGQIAVKAESKEKAMEIVSEKIEADELVPSQRYDGHDVTVDFADEV